MAGVTSALLSAGSTVPRERGQETGSINPVSPKMKKERSTQSLVNPSLSQVIVIITVLQP